MPNVKQALSSMEGAARDAELLGQFVWWGTSNACIKPAELADLFREHGLDPSKHLPEPPSRKLAFRRAVESAIAGERGMTRAKLVDDASETTYGIRLDRADELGQRVDAVQFARVTLVPHPTKPEGLFLTDNEEHLIVQEIKRGITHFSQNFVSDDIRRAIKSVLISAHAVPVTGRSWQACFVPSYSKDTVTTLARIVARITNNYGSAGKQTFTLAPVPAGDEWRQIGEQAARSEFGSKIDAAAEELASYQERLEDHLRLVRESDLNGTEYRGKGPRASALSSRLEEYKKLKEKIVSFSDALNFKAEDLLEKLDGVSKKVGEMVGQ